MMVNIRINSIIWIESFYLPTLNWRTTRCLCFAYAKLIDSSFFEESFFVLFYRKGCCMMNLSNFFITGAKGVGKSTLLKTLVEELEIKEDLTGFITLPYFEKDTRKGFYLHSMIEVAGNDKPISIQPNEVSCKSVKETFETLGVDVLIKSLEYPQGHVIMDELGVLEGEAYLFQEQVGYLLESSKIVFGVLKDKKHPFLEDIRRREDIRIYTLTEENRDEIKQQIKSDYLTRFSNK